MYPILFLVGEYAVYTVHFFLALSILLGIFVVWRIALVYDMDKEKVLDLSFWTLGGAFILSRLYYIFFHQAEFPTLVKKVFFNFYPGLSFWGGLIGGIALLIITAKRFKLSFWQMADFAITALFLGLAISSFGCLLGGCQYGLPSDWPIAIAQVGIVGKRFPLQVVESLLFLMGFIYLWKSVVKFHFNGKIASLGLILLGVIKLGLEPFRGDTQVLYQQATVGTVLSSLLILAGIVCYFRLSKKSVLGIFKSFIAFFINSNKREVAVSRMRRNWYNLRVSLKVILTRWRKRIFKTLHIRSNPESF
jgi:phosphatidylglycerol---prolipoprotein diacylglyceryl transferase